MKKLAVLVGLLIGLFSCVPDEPVRVMSFNIRYATPSDSLNYWEYRKDLVVSLLQTQASDFVGIQEALPGQIDYLSRELEGYEFIWRTREINPEEGEAVPLLYLPRKWKLIQSETFWLSGTPDLPGSNTWNGACNRVATWGLFESLKTGKRLLVCNTHFDHISQEARLNGARLIKTRLKGLFPEDPIVFMGDLNGKPNNPAVTALTDEWMDPYPNFYPDDTLMGTFHGFTGNPVGRRIDYILVYRLDAVSHMEILRDHRDGFYPSDHFPVLLDFRL